MPNSLFTIFKTVRNQEQKVSIFCLLNLKLNIYSNYNIDLDMRYCVFSKYFISDDGGFSKLLLTLQKMNNTDNYYIYFIYYLLILILILFLLFIVSIISKKL